MLHFIIGETTINFLSDIFDKDDQYDFLPWSDYNGPEQLEKYKLTSYDYIILFFHDKNVISGFFDILHEEKGIDKNRIIDFYSLYETAIPLMVCERRMLYPNISEYNGIIFGISHSEVGIIARLLKYPFCNMSVSSQDLFYNLKVLEYCIEYFPEKIKDLKYLIIDMFDYTYFNFDVSLSKNAVNYYLWGGYNLESHNFNNNHHFNLTHDEVIERISTDRIIHTGAPSTDYWAGCIKKMLEKNKFSEFYDYRNISMRTKTFSHNKYEDTILLNRSIQNNTFPDTISENIKYFENILKKAYEVNPNIIIYALIIPRYKETQDMLNVSMKKWKEIFYNIIEDMRKKYLFTFWDLNTHEISTNKNYYYDASHLNYYGAVQFTKWINDNILI